MADANPTRLARARKFTASTIALLCLAAALGILAVAHADAPSSPSRACFPASKWDAKDSRRPCARIVRVFEDGSVRVRVEDADGRFRYRAGVGAKDR
jgi:hypothetical protein